jgi:hypothetical protein
MPPRRILFAGGVLAVIVSFILYMPVLGKGFYPSAARDDELIVNAVQPYGLAGAWVYFRPDFWAQHINERWLYYRPILLLSHAADYALWGISPPLSRCVNLLLHCLNVVLLAALVFSMLDARPAARRGALPVAAMAACLFLLLPASAEPVSWIGARGDLLCSSFSLASMLALVAWGKTGKARWAALSLSLVLLALGTKETCLVLPFVAAVAAVWMTQRPMRARLAVCLIMLSCGAAYMLLRAHAGIFFAPPNVGGNLPRSLRRFGYWISRPATTIVEAVEIRDFHRLDVEGLAQTAAIALLLLQNPGPAAAFLGWKAAFYAPVCGFGILEPRYFYLPGMGSAALIALICWEGYAVCRRVALHLAPAPFLAWAWILACYLSELRMNIEAWVHRLA